MMQMLTASKLLSLTLRCTRKTTSHHGKQAECDSRQSKMEI